MLSFTPSEEQTVMKETLAKLVQSTVRDTAHDMDEKNAIPGEVIAKFRELGTALSLIPEELGGYGMPVSPLMNAIILEELAFGDMALRHRRHAALSVPLPHHRHGHRRTEEEVHTAVRLRRLRRHPGDQRAALQVRRRDPATVAAVKGGSYVINGMKCFVPLADRAKHMLVAAKCDGENSLFIVDAGNPGLKMGEREKNLGLYVLDTFTVHFNGCEVPEENRLGGDEGYDTYLQKTRMALAAIGTGVSRASFEYARDYSKERVQFGEPIASRQSVAFMIAEMAYEVDAHEAHDLEGGLGARSGKGREARVIPGEALRRRHDHEDDRLRRPGTRRTRVRPRPSGGAVLPQRPGHRHP